MSDLKHLVVGLWEPEGLIVWLPKCEEAQNQNGSSSISEILPEMQILRLSPRLTDSVTCLLTDSPGNSEDHRGNTSPRRF